MLLLRANAEMGFDDWALIEIGILHSAMYLVVSGFL